MVKMEKISKKLASAALLFALAISSAAAKNKLQEYDELLKTGTSQEIFKTLKTDSGFIKAQFGTEKANILMRSLFHNRDSSVINVMFRSGITTAAKDKNGWTALHYACRYSSDRKVIKKIVTKCVSDKNPRLELERKDKNGKTPLFYAMENPDTSAKEYLDHLLNGTPLNWDEESSPEEEKNNTSEEAAEETVTSENESAESTEEQISTTEENTDLSQSQNEPESSQQEEPAASETAENTETSEVIPAVTENEPEISEETAAEPAEEKNPQAKPAEIPASTPVDTNKYDKVFLYDFAEQDEEPEPEPEEELQELAVIEEPDSQDKNGRTALMNAVKNGNDWEIRSLLKSNADVNLRDKDGWTALMYAARYQNNLKMITLLLDSGADASTKNRYGATALQIAAGYSSNPDIIKKLISVSNASAEDVFNAFIMAITSNTTSAVTQISKLKVFLSYGVPINRFYEGRTPLMYAAQYSSSTEVIKLLLENGAQQNLRTPDGKTVFNFAESNKLINHDEIYWSLNQH